MYNLAELASDYVNSSVDTTSSWIKGVSVEGVFIEKLDYSQGKMKVNIELYFLESIQLTYPYLEEPHHFLVFPSK